MNNFSKKEMVEALKPHFKIAGFKKLRANWFKESNDTILVFNVQGSQWGPEYYLNLGIYIKALGEELKPPVYKCHIQCRIEHEENDVETIVGNSLEWFYRHDDIVKLRQLHDANKLPAMTFVDVYELLKTITITK